MRRSLAALDVNANYATILCSSQHPLAQWYRRYLREEDENGVEYSAEEKIQSRDCITTSGSGFHQLLAASKKRRKSPNPPKVLEPLPIK
jgi:hypothetical protein